MLPLLSWIYNVLFHMFVKCQVAQSHNDLNVCLYEIVNLFCNICHLLPDTMSSLTAPCSVSELPKLPPCEFSSGTYIFQNKANRRLCDFSRRIIRVLKNAHCVCFQDQVCSTKIFTPPVTVHCPASDFNPLIKEGPIIHILLELKRKNSFMLCDRGK